ncbi:hypothetical protein IWQ60_003796 [Tieghemiomyces parasiticus]|uniref:SIS domain-containing protein n=1 Tax=Tieghemiomyces parasiticus TaxID=78921 RepID=A0A9W8AA53_9FUNG|nr:hypothetical protein IWQ60_003796 [Tieghemiomyces parasiticus]
MSNLNAEAARILREAGEALLQCADRLDTGQVASAAKGSRADFTGAVHLMHQSLNQGGKIVITGVGKSGKIGEKLTATFLSLGVLTLFLHPTEALHGDLGMVGPRDIVLAISYSGCTHEVLQIVPFIRARGAHLIALVGNLESPLAQFAAASVDARVAQEATPDIPAPTTSTTLALAVGDALALCLMRLRACTPTVFANNHPGGALGQALYRPAVAISKDTSLNLALPTTPADEPDRALDVSAAITDTLSHLAPTGEADDTPGLTSEHDSGLDIRPFDTPPDSPPCGRVLPSLASRTAADC